MKTITDKHGKAHKLISHRVDNVALFIAVYNLDDIYENIHEYIKKENADAFLDVIKKLEQEVKLIKCNEITDIFLVEQGYNFDD
ncbi:MAG: hypothetical protein ACLUFN_02560 [Eubacterium sp.]